MTNQGDRLAGWKEIAAYLAKDVRTVLRWERQRGLPVHRPPGRTGQSVYAVRSELDRWLEQTREAPPPPSEAATPDAAAGWSVLPAVCLLALLAIPAALPPYARPAMHSLVVDARGVFALSRDGRQVWSYALDGTVETHSHRTSRARRTYIGDLDNDGRLDALVSVAYMRDQRIVREELLCFDDTGRRQWSATLDDEVRFGAGRFGPPWVGTDFTVFGMQAKTIVVSAHHEMWWPSIITTLDAAGQRSGRFVHSGWIMGLDVTRDERHIVAAGISNALNAAVVAVLDASDVAGHSPEPAGSPYACTDCGGLPLRYFVVRGTDAGAAARESLDRQYFGIAPSTQPTVRITHSSTTIPAPETILEFSPSLDLLRADFSDGYWPWHRELEREGRLSHRQADCPDRTGPRIEDWSSPARVTLAGVRRAP